MKPSPHRNALLVLALLSFIWSYNWIVMKQVLQWSGPFEFAAWRGVLGALMHGFLEHAMPILVVLLLVLAMMSRRARLADSYARLDVS